MSDSTLLLWLQPALSLQAALRQSLGARPLDKALPWASGFWVSGPEHPNQGPSDMLLEGRFSEVHASAKVTRDPFRATLCRSPTCSGSSVVSREEDVVKILFRRVPRLS